MKSATLVFENGQAIVTIDGQNPGAKIFLCVKESDPTVTPKPVETLLQMTHEQAENLALALIEVVREGKKHGK